MREIKFRGIPIKTDVVKFPDRFVIGYFLRQPKFDRANSGYLIADIESNEWVPVKPETIGQYTGLKDKNGSEIYKGDILWLKSNWNDDEFKLPVIFKDGMFQAKGSGLLCHYPDIQIIGNIHENPELSK